MLPEPEHIQKIDYIESLLTGSKAKRIISYKCSGCGRLVMGAVSSKEMPRIRRMHNESEKKNDKDPYTKLFMVCSKMCEQFVRNNARKDHEYVMLLTHLIRETTEVPSSFDMAKRIADLNVVNDRMHEAEGEYRKIIRKLNNVAQTIELWKADGP